MVFPFWYKFWSIFFLPNLEQLQELCKLHLLNWWLEQVNKISTNLNYPSLQKFAILAPKKQKDGRPQLFFASIRVFVRRRHTYTVCRHIPITPNAAKPDHTQATHGQLSGGKKTGHNRPPLMGMGVLDLPLYVRIILNLVQHT